MSINFKSNLPKVIGKFPINVKEYMHYQCMPIKLAGESFFSDVVYEDRLNVFSHIFESCIYDYITSYGALNYHNSYIYVTIKNRFVKKGFYINRPGYHIDGFGEKNCINYIWSNKFPTIFNDGVFDISEDDKQSLIDLDKQAKVENEHFYANKILLRLDDSVVHKCGEVTESTNRAFIKVTFSKLKYNLVGNSHNYLLDYKWDMVERDVDRNVQHK